MPIALDPQATFKVVLDVDKDKTPTPAFLYRYLSAARVRRNEEELEHIRSAGTAKDVWNKIQEIVLTGLVGWENLIDPETGKSIPFDSNRPEAIFDVCTSAEIGEIMARVSSGRTISKDDRKKSGPPSPTGTESSAGAVAGS